MAARSLAELDSMVGPEVVGADASASATATFGELRARVTAMEGILSALSPRPAPDWASGGHFAPPRGAHPLLAYGTDVLRREAASASASEEAAAKARRDARLLAVIEEELGEAQHELRAARSRIDMPVTVGEAVFRPDVMLGAGGLTGLAMQLLPADSLTTQTKLTRAVVVASAVGVGAYHYGKTRVLAERKATVDQLNRRMCDLRRERALYE